MTDQKRTSSAREIKFTIGHFYHVYNRGVEKRKIFLSDADYYRFIHNLYEFNDTSPASSLSSYYFRKAMDERARRRDNFGSRTSQITRRRKQLVNIIAFVLMPNHFHLLLHQRRRSGITTFLRKLGTGYTNYFNQKYDRTGHLFEGTFRAIEVEEERYLLHLVSYIHLNPIALAIPKWQKAILGKRDKKKAISFLEAYRWSSLLDYLKKKNFPSLINNEIIIELLGKRSYRRILFGALDADATPYRELTLED